MKKNEVHVHAHTELENMEKKEDVGVPKESNATVETDPLEKSDNIVLRKLLRRLRYFDSTVNGWENCYNCGEGGHATANCTLDKRIKPCFVFESLKHHEQLSSKGKICYMCKKDSHRAKDCPEKSNWGSQSTKICLNCGDSGHEMFSCENMYSSDDLKEIQCYVCKCFGHLCCVKYGGEGASEVSCYRCGQLGHSARECARVHAATASNWTPSSCYMCGEESHTICRCASDSKKKKRNPDSSTPKKKQKKKDLVGICENNLGARSMPQLNPRGRGGWMTENYSAYNRNHNHGWGSPMYMHMYNDRFQQFHGGSGYNIGYNSSGFHSGYNRGRYQHASRFGNSSSYGR